MTRNLPTAADLRAEITIPARGYTDPADVQRVKAALADHAMAAAAVQEDAKGRTLLASEERTRKTHGDEAVKLKRFVTELEDKLPLDPSERKMRFGQTDPDLTGGGTRAQAMRAIDGAHLVADEGRERLSRAVQRAHDIEDDAEMGRLAGYLAAASSRDYARAVGKLFRDPVNGHREFTGAELEAFQRARSVQRAMDTSTGSSGGFMLPTHLDPNIILTNAGAVDPMRLLSRGEVVTTDTWHGITSAGVTAAWYAQNAEVTDNTPTLGDAAVPTHRASAFVAASIETVMDTDIVGQVGKLFADAKMRLEGTAFTTGTGSGQPTGIIKGLDGGASEVAPATAETFARADVFALQEALSARWRANARYMANLSIINEMRDMPRLPSGTEVPLVDDSTTPPRLLGWDLHENSGMDGAYSTSATADNFLLLAGDFSEYVVVDRIGATIEFIPHLFGENRRPAGTRGWFMYWRTGGEPLVIDAFRLLNVATTA